MQDKPLKIYLSHKAKADFKNIQKYTFEQYGREQVLKYSSLIKAHLEKLSLNPNIGHKRLDIPEEYKTWRVGQHILVYRFDKNAVYVVAILHGNMSMPEQMEDRLNS